MELQDASYVSIAVGNPRYPVPYKIVNLGLLKPFGVFRVYSGDEYKKKYFERLDKYGAKKIRKAIEEVSEGHENVILMCHEKDKNECHRSMFAEWWFLRTGEKIPEIGEKSNEDDEFEQLELELF